MLGRRKSRSNKGVINMQEIKSWTVRIIRAAVLLVVVVAVVTHWPDAWALAQSSWGVVRDAADQLALVAREISK